MTYVDPATAGTPATGQAISAQWGIDVQQDLEAFAQGTNAVKIQNQVVSSAAPTIGQTLVWNGSTWLPYAGIKVIAVKTANYTLTGNDEVVVFNGTSLTATLPAANSVPAGKVFRIKNINATALTWNTTTAQTVDGATTGTLAQYAILRVVSDGTSVWYGI